MENRTLDVRMGLRLDRETHELLLRLAAAEDRSLSAVVRQALKRLALERLTYTGGQE